MLGRRSALIAAAAPAGMVLAALAWFVLDGGRSVDRPLDRLEARLAATGHETRDGPILANDPVVQALATPLFALTTGPNAVADPVVRLDGIAISPRGKSALLSIDSKPAGWVNLGASANGVTLMEVRPSEVVIDTAIGFKTVALWSTPPVSSH